MSDIALNKVCEADTTTQIIAMSHRMRRLILETALEAGAASAHLGGALSIVDMVATLYGGVMNYDAANPEWEGRDRFILSKGHGVLGYYTALTDLGVISHQELMQFEKTGSFLLGHPVINRSKGIEFSNGSLGMGLSLGIGVSLAARMKQKTFRTFVVMGDGECNEGSVWEAAMSAVHHKLDNLVAIVDNNGWQQTGSNQDISNSGQLLDRFESFGWCVKAVDGHDHATLLDALLHTKTDGQPLALIAKTVKGKGFSAFEGNNAWHHAVLTQKQYDECLLELPAEFRGAL